ncbi:MAG: nucleotidyltransferase domain-containing protein [Candidatus Bathyarchaeota archaeon]|nr:MAG: nucleotidyltransferase domain-containing protein [Candidatus Bathyarchaeota archaeon]
MEVSRLQKLRKRVAREAAILLYTSQEKEYKQAKIRASQTLSVRILPANAEVAVELDRIAEEREGPSRPERLARLREEALRLMTILQSYNPRLIGSVWRGTANKSSDIDIIAFASDHNAVLTSLQEKSLEILETKWISVTKQGKKESTFHIHLLLSSGNQAEVVIQKLEKVNISRRCEIYGDYLTGLDYSQLQRVLKENPLQRFTPD